MPPRGPSALVVEDNHDLRYLFRVSLSVAGFQVREAADGYQALVAIEEDRPDILILDLGLPRVSGFTVLEEIAARADINSVAVVVVTGLDITENLGVTILRKPVDPSVLISTVRTTLRRSASGAQS